MNYSILVAHTCGPGGRMVRFCNANTVTLKVQLGCQPHSKNTLLLDSKG